jgi:hypothetical protein
MDAQHEGLIRRERVGNSPRKVNTLPDEKARSRETALIATE